MSRMDARRDTAVIACGPNADENGSRRQRRNPSPGPKPKYFDVELYGGCFPCAVWVAPYQLIRSIRFISGSPVRLAVATSEVIFPNNWGFLKSTVEFGAEKPKLWKGFWKS
jgi:hypothetical protein